MTKLVKGFKFGNNVKTITRFYVYCNDVKRINNNIETFEEALKYYNELKEEFKNEEMFFAVGFFFNDNFLGGAFDVIYNETVKVNDVFLYNHDVIANRIHSHKSSFHVFKDELKEVFYK